jgi:hypothetical protein
MADTTVASKVVTMVARTVDRTVLTSAGLSADVTVAYLAAKKAVKLAACSVDQRAAAWAGTSAALTAALLVDRWALTSVGHLAAWKVGKKVA